jgi:hypothetical protein
VTRDLGPPEKEGPSGSQAARPHQQLADPTTNDPQHNNGELVGHHLDTLGAEALDYARHHWPVFPLRGKVPAIPKRLGGRGVLDATTDVEQVIVWWSGRYRGCNIGLRLPGHIIVIDIDPRNGGLEALAELENRHGKLPETLTTISGRGDGGYHAYFRRPPGELSGRRLGRGVDLKTHLGYVVAAPSVHPDTGKPYVRVDHPVATPPAWLITLLLPEKPAHRITAARPRLSLSGGLGRSIADDFSANTSWAEILEPHGWTCSSGDPDADGARWLHPTHTSACSATVRNGCLFVYSTSTVFDVTEPSNPKGYTRFRAYALLEHGGDMKAAARHLRGRK